VTTESARNLHIYFLLDRSGSMASIASDVVGGFNSFLETQKADGDDALLTMVQFDSQDPHEVLADAVPISEARPLEPATFQPRGSTPLYDAMGHLVADATIRRERLRAQGKDPEEFLFVTFTDGLENHSREYTRDKIFELVKKREADGWSFAYLGANQDSYAEGGQIGYSAASIQNFAPDAAGAKAAFASLSTSTARRRSRIRHGESYDAGDFFEGDKQAEDDLRSRNPS
jgi:Mg-chelatase subunit ChlD